MTVRLVCFDLGGVLVRLCTSWTEAAEAAGIEARVDQLASEPQRAVHRAIDLYQRGDMTSEAYYDAMSLATEGAYDTSEIRLLHTAWLRGTYEATSEWIRELHDRGLVTAVLSNTNESHWAHMLEHYEPLRLVQHPLASHLLRERKPDAAIYAAAERALPARGAEVLFFDDMAENVDAARAHGWRADLIDPAHETVPQMRAALEAS